MARARNKTQGTNTPPTAETLLKTQSVASDIDNIEVKADNIDKTATNIEKQPCGRKPIEDRVTPKFLDQLTAFASQSIPNLKIAELLEVSSASFYKLMSESPEFRAAYEKGIDNRKYELEKALIKRAEGFSAVEVKTETDADGKTIRKTVTDKNYVPDTTALIFALKNLHSDKYKDRIESVNTVNVNIQQIQNIPDEELLQYANLNLIEADFEVE